MATAVRRKADVDPIFSRGDVAKVLNVTTATIANREKKGQYPEPRRDLNDYRVYTLHDLMTLQILTYGSIDTRPLMSLLYDHGYRDPKEASQIIDRTLDRRRGL